MIRAWMLAIAALALHAATSLAAGSLASQATSADGWVAWNVPMVAGSGSPCCYVERVGHEATRGCDLDGHHDGFMTSDEARASSHADLTVYAHVANGTVDDVRGLDATCPVRTAGPIRRIDDAASAQSIAFLAGWIDGRASDRIDDAIAAIALHEDASATTALAKIADPAHPRKQRESAIFWLSQARGGDGAAIVERFATSDADPKLREHAIFALTQSQLTIPEDTGEFAINMSNMRHWEAPMKKYIDELLAGKAGPRKRDFNMRWVASMVADVHRILTRGGVFIYPRDMKDPSRPGKLRLMYEANPMAFIVEQAGGAATDGHRRILEIEPGQLHQRVAVFLGSKNEVLRATRYHREAAVG